MRSGLSARYQFAKKALDQSKDRYRVDQFAQPLKAREMGNWARISVSTEA